MVRLLKVKELEVGMVEEAVPAEVLAQTENQIVLLVVTAR
jgi:hypothetical protein